MLSTKESNVTIEFDQKTQKTNHTKSNTSSSGEDTSLIGGTYK